jgi:hypothetical protein
MQIRIRCDSPTGGGVTARLHSRAQRQERSLGVLLDRLVGPPGRALDKRDLAGLATAIPTRMRDGGGWFQVCAFRSGWRVTSLPLAESMAIRQPDAEVPTTASL